MKKLMGATGLTLACIAAIGAQAATVVGRWHGTTRNGSDVVLDLTVKNDTLTGTVTRDGEATSLTDGKVSKGTIAFKAKLGEQIEALSGQRDGEQLKVWLDRQGPEMAVLFTRVKASK